MISHLAAKVLLFTGTYNRTFPSTITVGLSKNAQESQLHLLFCDDDSQRSIEARDRKVSL